MSNQIDANGLVIGASPIPTLIRCLQDLTSHVVLAVPLNQMLHELE